MEFKFTDNYKSEFSRYVCEITRKPNEGKYDKNKIVKKLMDDYVEQTGERPDYRELDELASWLIFGYKGLTNRKKMEIKTYEGSLLNA
jgi:hypothetical protein